MINMPRYVKIAIAIYAVFGLPLVPIGDALGWSGEAIGTATVGVVAIAITVQSLLMVDELDRRERPRND